MVNLQIHIANYSLSPLFILLLIGGVIGIITFFFLIKVIKTPGVKFMLVWQLVASIWAFAYAFEFAADDINTKILWSKFSYLGIVYCPVSFLFFSLAFASKYNFLKRKYVHAVYSFATIFILFPFTNEFHHLHWKSYSIDPLTHATNYVYGPLFWIMTFFAYLALMGGIINIFLLYFRSSQYYRQQISLLFIASVLPPIGNLVYIFQINPISGFDWTPFTFLFTGLLIAINLSYFKMFELVPFARNQLIDIIPDAILVVDNSFHIADLNPAMGKMIESHDKELIGRPLEQFFPLGHELVNQINQNDDFEIELTRVFSGNTYHFEFHSSALFDQNRQPTGKLIVLKDITRYIEAEEKVKESNVRLRNEIEEKEKLITDLDSFSHTVAHDLKNMLGAIVSASNLIRIGVEDMSKEDLLEINDLIRQSATKTMHITRELLTLASVRQQEVKLVKVDMQLIVSEALKRLNDMIQESETQILLSENFPDVMGYEGWLEEVWINFISNAIKYGGTPPVVELGSELLDNNRVRFWIKDNGKGLSEDDMELLFNKFTRLDILRAEGHGLGLSIVKRIVEKLNGEVGVQSQNVPGQGCTFYFDLFLQ